MKNIKISEEAHTKIVQNYNFGETFANVVDRLLGITANSKKGGRK